MQNHARVVRVVLAHAVAKEEADCRTKGWADSGVNTVGKCLDGDATGMTDKHAHLCAVVCGMRSLEQHDGYPGGLDAAGLALNNGNTIVGHAAENLFLMLVDGERGVGVDGCWR